MNRCFRYLRGAAVVAACIALMTPAPVFAKSKPQSTCKVKCGIELPCVDRHGCLTLCGAEYECITIVVNICTGCYSVCETEHITNCSGCSQTYCNCDFLCDPCFCVTCSKYCCPKGDKKNCCKSTYTCSGTYGQSA